VTRAPARATSRELLEGARDLLVANTRLAVKDGRAHTFTVPSSGRYPFQWFWDSCFHAITWSLLDPARAAAELRSLLAWQEPDGFIPHVVFWDSSRVRRIPLTFHFLETRELAMVLPGGPKPRTTRHIQPPVLAQAVERVVLAGETSFLSEALPALERYYRWLARARDPDGDGLISTIAQFESGLDYSPAYDPVVGASARHPLGLIVRTRWPELTNKLRRFDLPRIFATGRHHQEDVLVNTLYAQGLAALARLAATAGESSLERWAAERSRAISRALVARCWDPEAGLFWNLAGPDERPSRVRTVISLLPLALDDLPRDVVDALVTHLTDPREFWAPYPVPSVALHEPSFVPGIHVRGVRLIWRGPLSLNTNWFLVHGLRRHGEHELAEEIAERSRALVRAGGFNEFYDPLSGAPVGELRFGWATLVCDL
jgi:glycogen debranching enzyme